MTTDKIQRLYDQALENYKSNGRNDYDAGIVEGLKRALEVIKLDALGGIVKIINKE